MNPNQVSLEHCWYDLGNFAIICKAKKLWVHSYVIP